MVAVAMMSGDDAFHRGVTVAGLVGAAISTSLKQKDLSLCCFEIAHGPDLLFPSLLERVAQA